MEVRCAHCRFWVRHAQDRFGQGDCRRHAPIIHVLLSTDPNRMPTTIFPTTGPMDACGDFKIAGFVPMTPDPSADAAARVQQTKR